MLPFAHAWRELHLNEAESLRTGTFCYTLGPLHLTAEGKVEYEARLQREQDALNLRFVKGVR